jgi:hypothetical protein
MICVLWVEALAIILQFKTATCQCHRKWGHLSHAPFGCTDGLRLCFVVFIPYSVLLIISFLNRMNYIIFAGVEN